MTQIFVFGSNKEGRHGKGAALEAHSNWGAVKGVGEGLTGFSYAIPTKRYSDSQKDRWGNPQLVVRPITNIRTSIKRFNEYASTHPTLTFLVTEVGCGLAGFKASEIAPMFAMGSLYKNIFFPERFLPFLGLERDRMSFTRDNKLTKIHEKERKSVG